MNTKKKENKKMFPEIFKDKNGYYSLRELVTALFVVIVFIGWIGQQFFGLVFPEYMFYGFISLIAAGCFGYSIERKQKFPNNNNLKNSNYE
jgi:hypothetical protein